MISASQRKHEVFPIHLPASEMPVDLHDLHGSLLQRAVIGWLVDIDIRACRKRIFDILLG